MAAGRFAARAQVRAAGLDEVLSTSRVMFVFAGSPARNELLGQRELELIQPGSAFLLMSRAAVVDFPELAGT